MIWQNTNAATGEREVWDTDAGTYTRRNAAGTLVETRALTPEEITAYSPPPTVSPTPEERLAAAAQALAPLDTLSAPVLPADILDVLVAVRTALEA